MRIAMQSYNCIESATTMHCQAVVSQKIVAHTQGKSRAVIG